MWAASCFLRDPFQSKGNDTIVLEFGLWSSKKERRRIFPLLIHDIPPFGACGFFNPQPDVELIKRSFPCLDPITRYLRYEPSPAHVAALSVSSRG